MLKYKIPQIVTLTRIDYIKGYDRYEKSPSNCMFNGLLFHFGLKTVGLPRFELGQTEPKPVVLPLHHSPIINHYVLSLESGAKIRFSCNIFQIFSHFFLQ